MQEAEQSQITVAAGFDADEIRLTGNLLGEAPYQGILIHKGWKVQQIDLPKINDDYNASVIASAEVEL